MNKVISTKYQETYLEETLPNGLKVVLWQKPNYQKSHFVMGTPLGAFDLKQVDSENNEISFPAGIAHFLEHKMFENEQNEDVMDQFSAMGANVNAQTSYDETCYFFTTSANPLPALELLLEFTQDLSINEASVEKEKGIICQELAMYRQMVDFRLIRETFISLYKEHPFKHDIGGDDESVNATTLQQLQQCYAINYHPSNMILVGVSSLDPSELLDHIKANQANKTFKPAKTIKRAMIVEPKEVNRKDYVFSMEMHQPKINIAYKLSGIKDPLTRFKKETSIRILLDTYFSSMSDDYQRWLREDIVSDFFGYDIEIGEDYGHMMFYTETKKLDEFKQVIQATLIKLINSEINEKAFEQLKRRYFGQNIRDLNDFEYIANSVMRYYFDDISFFDVLDIIDQIQVSDLVDCKSLLSIENVAIVTAMPKD